MSKIARWTTAALLGLSACIATALLVTKDSARLLPHGPEALEAWNAPEASPTPNQMTALATFWSKQAEQSLQAGFAEAADDYRERLAAYAAGLPSLPPFMPDSPLLQNNLSPMTLYLRTAASPGQKGTASASAAAPPLAKFEPASGVYLGMLGADRRVGYDVTKIEGVYGRKHALYLAYVGWRKVQTDTDTYFPARTAERVKALDGALQIGWEPRYGLDDVLDDEYVRRFAREAKASGIPIFLRYASEMNGAWVPWHGDPQKYIEKFRLVHDIMAEEAPNVALVWSPNFSPQDTIDDYYPGDAYVDWVGFSLYATPYASGKEHLQGSVIDTFAPLYERYSHKPIMISEGAIAHTYLPTNQTYWRWAEDQLGYMYGVLPRLFPQVKAVTYFNFSKAQAVRTKGDYVYDIGENPFMEGYYQRLISSDWFLSGIEQGANPITDRYVPVTGRSLPAGKQTVLAYPRLDNAQGEAPFAVAVYQGGQLLGASFEAPWEMALEVRAEAASAPWYAVAFNRKLEVVSVSGGGE